MWVVQFGEGSRRSRGHKHRAPMNIFIPSPGSERPLSTGPEQLPGEQIVTSKLTPRSQGMGWGLALSQNSCGSKFLDALGLVLWPWFGWGFYYRHWGEGHCFLAARKCILWKFGCLGWLWEKDCFCFILWAGPSDSSDAFWEEFMLNMVVFYLWVFFFFLVFMF